MECTVGRDSGFDNLVDDVQKCPDVFWDFKWRWQRREKLSVISIIVIYQLPVEEEKLRYFT